MNWNEFLRTMTWFLSPFALVGSVVFIAAYAEGKRSTWKIVVAVILFVTAILGFSVIGGMNWGPAQ